MFKLNPDPTFHATVDIPKHGGGVLPLKLEFKHRTTDELDEFIKAESTLKMDNVDLVMAFAVGWADVDAPFSAEAVATLCKNYKAAPFAIRDKYLEEITQARLGN